MNPTRSRSDRLQIPQHRSSGQLTGFPPAGRRPPGWSRRRSSPQNLLILSALAFLGLLSLAEPTPCTGSQEPSQSVAADRLAQANPPRSPDAKSPEVDEIIQKLAAHFRAWIAPPSQIAELEYESVSRPLVIPIKAIRGESQPENVWMGATLHTGFHTLLESPSRFDLDIQRDPKAQTTTLHAKLKEDKTSVRIEVGNGVKASWLGYFSHPTRRVTLVVDAERFVPLEEQTDSSQVFYLDWPTTGSGGWVPRPKT